MFCLIGKDFVALKRLPYKTKTIKKYLGVNVWNIIIKQLDSNALFQSVKTVEILNWLWYDKLWISKRKRPLEGQNIHILKGHRKYMK